MFYKTLHQLRGTLRFDGAIVYPRSRQTVPTPLNSRT